MTRKPLINNESGIALVIALVMLLALTVIGISSLLTSTLDLQMSGNERRAMEALNLADAGMQRAVHDVLEDLDKDEGSFLNNNTMTVTSIYNASPVSYDLGVALGDFDCLPQPSCVSLQFGDPFALANIAGASIGNAVDPYGGAQEFGDGYYRVLILRDPGEAETIYVRSYAQHSTGARKIIQLRMKLESLDVWKNAIFAGRGSATASITGSINVSGSVHVLGAGATNEYTISGAGGVFNGYKALGLSSGWTHTEMLNRVAYDTNGDNVFDNLEVIGFAPDGKPIYTLESEFRVKNVQTYVTGSGSIGEAANYDMDGDGDKDISDYDGTYWQSNMDNVYANKSIDGASVYADNIEMPNGYDLGDKIQMPAFNDPYTDTNGTDWLTYKEYIESQSLTIPPKFDHDNNPSTADVSLCTLKPTVGTGGAQVVGTPAFDFGTRDGMGKCIDPKGCIKWNPGDGTTTIRASLEIDGRVKFDTDAAKDASGNPIAGTYCNVNEIVIGAAKKTILYTGKGLIYTDKNMYIKGNLVTGNYGTDYYIKDDLLGLLTPGNVRIAEGGAGGDTNSQVMAGIFAGGLISTEQPSQLVGTIVSNQFCLGGTELDASGNTVCKSGGNASDIFYVPYMSEEMRKLGMITGNRIYSFKEYKWDLVY